LAVVLSSLGQEVSVIAAGGMICAPKTNVPHFNCLGYGIENFSVVALDLPMRSPAAGLLGMDFLITIGAVIDVKKGEILLLSVKATKAQENQHHRTLWGFRLLSSQTPILTIGSLVVSVKSR
jgi:hypothetical protein